MTPELQRAMARYEEAWLEYRKVVLRHASDGAAIRQAIRSFQEARAQLKQVEAALRPAPEATKARATSSATSDPQPHGLLRLLRAS